MPTLTLAPFTRFRFHTLLLCVQVALIAGAAHAESGNGAWFAAILLAVLSAFGWLRALGTLRQITDTPVSRIASAAQGFVALRGRARPLSGLPLVSPFNGLPVLWYRLLTEDRDGQEWRTVSDHESDACFLLEDASGLCAVDPAGADIHAQHRECETRGDMRYTQWCILEQEALHVLGDFHTLHGDNLTRSEREAVRDILAEWKQDRDGLMQRFDLDRSGDLNETEWDLARAEALREARRQRIEADKAASLHIVRKPRTGRPFIVSAVKPWRLKLPHYSWCALNAALFLLACTGINALVQSGSVALF